MRPLCSFGWNGRIGRGPGSGAVPPGVENRADTADTVKVPTLTTLPVMADIDASLSTFLHGWGFGNVDYAASVRVTDRWWTVWHAANDRQDVLEQLIGRRLPGIDLTDKV